MIREALQLIQETAQAAVGIERLGATNDGRHEMYRVGGQLVERAVPPPVRSHTMCTLADLAAYVEAMDTPGDCVAWFSQLGVVLVLDDSDRRDQVAFPLSHWPAFAELLQLEASPRTFDQRSFIQFCVLRLGIDKAVMMPFRRMDWNMAVATSGVVQAGRDRMGKEVNAQVSGAGDLPEDLLVRTRVFSQQGETLEVEIVCDVDLKPAEQRIAISPQLGATKRATEAAMVSIRERLAELLPEGIAIYYGSP